MLDLFNFEIGKVIEELQPAEGENTMVALAQHIALIKVVDVTNRRKYDFKKVHEVLVELVVSSGIGMLDLGFEARKYKDGYIRELTVLVSAVGAASGLVSKVYEGWSFAEIVAKAALRAGIDK